MKIESYINKKKKIKSPSPFLFSQAVARMFFKCSEKSRRILWKQLPAMELTSYDVQLTTCVYWGRSPIFHDFSESEAHRTLPNI